MKQLIGKIMFCSIFIFLMLLAILEYEKAQTVNDQVVSEFPAIEYISQNEAEQIITNTKGVVIIDVRNNNEYIQSHLENAINIPVREINEHLPELEQYKDKIIIIYCDTGRRSKTAAIQLKTLGYKHLYVIKNGVN